MGLFDKFKKVFKKEEKEDIQSYEKGLSKTRDEFVSKLSLLGIKYTKVNEEYYEELERILIEADIGVKTVYDLLDKLRKRVKEENITNTKELGRDVFNICQWRIFDRQNSDGRKWTNCHIDGRSQWSRKDDDDRKISLQIQKRR